MHTSLRRARWLTLLLVLILLLAACNHTGEGATGGEAATGAETTGAETTGAETTGAETTGGEIGETPAVDDASPEPDSPLEMPTGTPAEGGDEGAAAAPEATGVPPIECQEGQQELVWMVRNGQVENQWEADVVRPAFQRANPDICLQIQSINQDDIAVVRETMIASGEPLHVWSTNWGGDGFASDRVRGLIEDLTPLIERDNFDTTVFNQDVLQIYEAEGKIWGLPFLTTGSYVYYNQDMFKEAGVDLPPFDWEDKSWTWDKMVQTAKQLTKNTENINQAQFGIVADWLNLEGPPMMFGHFIWPEDAYKTGFAAEGVNVTNEASINAWQAYHDLRYKDQVAPEASAAQALEQLGGAFASGRVAMQITGGWGHWAWAGLMTDPQGFCWGAAPLPWGSPDADTRAVIYTDPWVITADLPEEERDMAWTFVKFLVSPEQARAYMETTGTPPTQTALLNDYYKQFSKCVKESDMKTVFEGAFAHGRESSNHLIVKWDELNQVWQNAIPTMLDDPGADVKATLEEVEAGTNEALQRIAEEEQQTE